MFGAFDGLVSVVVVSAAVSGRALLAGVGGLAAASAVGMGTDDYRANDLPFDDALDVLLGVDEDDEEPTDDE